MKRRYLLTMTLALCLLAGCGKQAEPVYTLVEETVLSGGVRMERWREENGHMDQYRLPDGTLLLTVEGAHGPEGSHVAGQESYDDLSEAAREAVSAYYEAQGLLYDLRAELERACAAYLEGRNPGDRWISQHTVPTASNGRMMCFSDHCVPAPGRAAHGDGISSGKGI